MKKYILFLCFFVFTFHYSFSQGVWTWMGGDTIPGGQGVFGTQGIPSVNNYPPALYSPFCWTDLQGNFWIFGGKDESGNTYGDMWKFNSITLEWTWVNGTGTKRPQFNYGAKGVLASGNTPGGRSLSDCVWVDTNGDLWLYDGGGQGGLADLWKYNIASNEWACMSGFSKLQPPVYGMQGVPSPLNTPGSRQEIGNPWVDANGKFWVYGGCDYTGLYFQSDMWMYDPVTNMWTWESGSQNTNVLPVYGTKGNFSPINTPGGRWVYAMTKENNGNFLLFGGFGNQNTYADLWEYNSSINQWAWISGTQNKNAAGIEGVACQSDSTFYPDTRFENRAVWKDCAGNFWMFGGQSFNPNVSMMGDIWVYLTADKKWARMSDSSYANTNPVYGMPGISALSNQPGSRFGTAQWKDKRGDFWIFGGADQQSRPRGDIWRYIPDYNCISVSCNCPAYAGFLISSRDSICYGAAVTSLINTTGSSGSLQWQSSTDGINFSEIFGDTLNTYTTPPTLAQTTYYRLIAESGSCGTDTSNTVTIQILPAPSVNFTYNTNGKQLNFQVDSVSGNVTTYHWDFGDGKTSNEINPVHTFDSLKTYYVCLTVYNNSNCSFTRCEYVSPLNGVQNGSVNQSIRLYPNPANDELTIEVLNAATPKQITITDDLGGTLIQLSTDKIKTRIDVGSLAASIYFVKTQMADGGVQVNKFVKE